ncbi:MAG: AarF/ABC1/UbiB kinase family protein [Candidatus Firestonebacteria bacterium]
MDIIKITKTYRNLKRLTEIANVLFKYGFEYLVDRMNLIHLIPFRKRIKLIEHKEEKFEIGEKLKLICEELGTTFIKFGQILSLRTDIFPENVTNELSKLQDEVKPFSYKEAKVVLEKEYKVKLEEIFSYFKETPYASASISQVHFATLKSTKEKVIVKVQRPNIEKEVKQDIDILYYLAHLIEKYFPEFKVYNPSGIVEEFEKTIYRELDFTYELSNAEMFRKIFKDSQTVYIPKVYYEYSSKKVLVMEYLDGIKITSCERAKKVDKILVTSNLINAYHAMVFESGFFHADPHPGNIFVLKDNRIGFVDFGMVGYINDKILKKLAYLFLSFVEEDLDLREYECLGIIAEYEENIEYEKETIELLNRYRGFPLQKIDISRVIRELSELARRYDFRFPRDLMLLGKTLLTIERIVRDLNPGFNFVVAGEPFARKFIERNLQPKMILKEAERNILSLYQFLRDLPKELSDIFRKIKKGNLKIEFEHIGLEPLISEIDKATNRLAFSFIIGSLIIGSSIITYAGFGPKIFGLPAYGMAGYLIAAFLGLWLIIAIIKANKL